MEEQELTEEEMLDILHAEYQQMIELAWGDEWIRNES